MKWFCAIYDRFQGRITLTVNADTEDQADEEAMIGAAELGCTDITDVICSITDVICTKVEPQ